MGRKGHKEGCQCAICRKVDAKVARVAATPLIVAVPEVVKPLEVNLGSLPCGSMFEFRGAKYRVGEKSSTVVVSDQFRWVGDMKTGGWQFVKRAGLGTGTMVKPL